LYDEVRASREQAAERFAVDSTPTFFVGGQKLVGETSIGDFDKALEPLLK